MCKLIHRGLIQTTKLPNAGDQVQFVLDDEIRRP